MPGALSRLTWEPVSGFEPLTCRLQVVRLRAPYVLAAPMARLIALAALVALGLSSAPFHEPFHAEAAAFVCQLLCVTYLEVLYPGTRAGPVYGIDG